MPMKLVVLSVAMIAITGCSKGDLAVTSGSLSDYQGSGFISQGPAKPIVKSLY